MWESPNAPAHLRDGFRDILSVQVVSHHAKYLGLPVVLDRRFSANFIVILDRICGKVGGWSSSYLSCGGKEILIKVVLQAIPQYFMHCFLLPDCIIYKIQSLIHNFWWRQSEGSQPIHWVKASWLATSKEEGGLGFKILKLVNIAFLVKQAWRLYKNPNLLLSQVLRGRYYPDTDIFHASIGYRPSKCWRSILGVVDLLRAGCDADVGGSLFWKFSSSQEYDVRSGYQLAVHISKQNVPNKGEVSNPSRLKVFWKLFWKLPIPRKVKIFGWRCYHNGLPVEFRKASNVSLNSHQSLSDFEWKPPGNGIVKINCDASWDETCKFGGVAAVARDYEGSILGGEGGPRSTVP
ncbi:hypothetical protein QQ045_002164 [Rhodiola kirilowii]